tara:strand:+ start:794 stop:1360 length:567 start_codon:yes stop_codon:yes gene_type:complete
MSFGKVISDVLKSRFEEGDFRDLVLEPVADIYLDSFKILSKRGVDATGSPFRGLVPKYAREKLKKVSTSKADLHYGAAGADKNTPSRVSRGATQGAFEVIDYTVETASNKFVFNFSNNRTITDYMKNHQSGGTHTGRKNLPKRKWFPEPNDLSSPPQQQNIAEISKLIARHLESDPKVKGKFTFNISL